MRSMSPTNSGYSALAQWARPDSPNEIPLGIKADSPVAYRATIFEENIGRIRALAVLPGVIAAHARGPDVNLAVGAERVDLSHSALWVAKGTNSHFASVLIGALTAFEVRATDVWRDAVNLLPHRVGEHGVQHPPLFDAVIEDA